MCEHEGRICPANCRCECMNCMFDEDDFASDIAGMTFLEKMDALVEEGGYTRKEARVMLEEMGEGE